MISDPEVHVEYLALQIRLLMKVRPPRSREQQIAAMDLAYANLATSSLQVPSRYIFAELALDRYGWSPIEFQQWADCGTKTTWHP